MAKFELDRIVVTRGIELARSDLSFAEFVNRSIERYKNCDWGDTCEDDRRTNEIALKNGNRILAVYKYPKGEKTIWIITEWDRSVTTILFKDEYYEY